jgi:hypothetical protein
LNPNKPIPFNIAYQTEQMMFNWFQRPENSYNVSRFAVAMQGTAATEPADLIFQGACILSSRIEALIPNDQGLIGVCFQTMGPSSTLVEESDICLSQLRNDIPTYASRIKILPQPLKYRKG